MYHQAMGVSFLPQEYKDLTAKMEAEKKAAPAGQKSEWQKYLDMAAGLAAQYASGLIDKSTLKQQQKVLEQQMALLQAQGGRRAMPGWVLPVAIGGGALLLVLLLRRRG